ncbi:hypothetical protein M9H77_05142 [Catharanthus roseus]|uniref:Uncharacterized protein n=1 Tax=Catharanthus roseus TaxID=4058 RepID=A0ACC0CG29_CATRO|nr:hypothetical protein M9H77_05142 [Catharanthus roseus]
MGSNNLIKTPLSTLFISLIHSAIFAYACPFPPFQLKFHIHVVNNLPNNSNPLTVHCQSKDTDLGYHTLHVNEEIQWHFCTHIVFRTLFFCHFWWNNKQAVFDVFKETHDFGVLCQNTIPGEGRHTCHWAVKEDGFYLVFLNAYIYSNNWS